MTDNLPLGRQVAYSFTYDPTLLCPIPRRLGREAAGIAAQVTGWLGEDIWNIYELSWLSPSGKPEVAMAELRVPADSPNLIESKSLKLYCNSLNMSTFANGEEVRQVMAKDLSRAAGAEVQVVLVEPGQFSAITLTEPAGFCLDGLDIGQPLSTPDPSLLTVGAEQRQETLFSRLFRSCCPVTGQPDWATIAVSYQGGRITPERLLAHLISYRQHTGFHEACVERIYSEIMARCRPDQLTITARFTRRGGIDINPVRASSAGIWPNMRDPRQ